MGREVLSRGAVPFSDEALEHVRRFKLHCIRLVVRGRRRLDQWQFREDGRITQVQVRGSLSTSSGEVMHDWAVAGRGVAQKFLWDVQDDLRAGRLMRLLESFECEEAKLYLTFPTRTYLPPRMRLFIDFIVSALQGSASG